ncbi:unnamed protein product (macronuclear) [Paramecium tetraurelia]|uniref:Uncharacterized protein n=1 Tax=Paramecium tetraurelia TaxID=5888 RepID=A0C3D9_PARTE|nr:uncharacterized protein GSPATT00034785001 [Paramecium tetraurelia]CAK65306.1 unnamed protein product [Paramecium tetraurelia]|eukprot:XP_001432703.1 hypothetical protein (macronuclear) [Paramecium tetraurelia strain d4-2]
MGQLQYIIYNDGSQNKQFKICDIPNEFFQEFHFQVSLPCILHDSHLTKIEEQFKNNTLFNNLKRKVQQANQKYIRLKDISQYNLFSYVTNTNKVTLTDCNKFAIEKIDERLLYYFSITIQEQYFIYSSKEAKIMIEDFIISVIVLPNNKRFQILNNDTDESLYNKEYKKQIPIYTAIWEQLKYENEKWTLNLSKEECTFYKKVDQYPESFYLNEDQTLIVRCRYANVRVSQIGNQ